MRRHEPIQPVTRQLIEWGNVYWLWELFCSGKLEQADSHCEAVSVHEDKGGRCRKQVHHSKSAQAGTCDWEEIKHILSMLTPNSNYQGVVVA